MKDTTAPAPKQNLPLFSAKTQRRKSKNKTFAAATDIRRNDIATAQARKEKR